MRRGILFAMGVILLGGGSARAIEGEWGVSTTLAGQYIFRGVKVGPAGLMNDAAASFELSPRLSADAYIWQYIQLDNGTGFGEHDYDLSLTYVPRIFRDKVSLTGGYIFYDVNNDPTASAFLGTDTQEAYGIVSVDVPWSPYVAAFYDFDSFTGTYLKVGAGRDWVLGDSGWTLGTSASAGFDFGRTNGWQDVLVRGALSYELQPGLTFGPAVDFWFTSDDITPNNNFRTVGYLGFAYGDEF